MIFKLEEKIKDRNQRKVMIDADYCAEHLLKDRAIDRISTSHIYKTPVIRGF
jgi:hypothetical protein